MVDVNSVFITKEVAEKLDTNPAYLIRVAKALADEGKIKDTDMRPAGKRNYIFNENALKELKKKLNK